MILPSVLLAATSVTVGGMSEARYGIDTVEKIASEGLGNYTVLFRGPWSAERIREVGDFCRAHGMRFTMDEAVHRLTGKLRGSYVTEPGKAMAAARSYSDVLDGSLLLCEYGGLMFNWPESTVATAATKPPLVRTYAEAASNAVFGMSRIVAYAEENGIPRPYISIEPTGGAMPFVIRGGIDRFDIEVSYGADLERRFAAAIGTAEAFRLPRFGADMAMVWYGGWQHDALWFERWRTSLYHAYLRGANPIYAEHGIMDYEAYGKKYGEVHPDVAGFRRELGAFARWVRAHPRADGFPRAAVAAVQGRYDGYVGGWQTHQWGQRLNDAWRIDEADRAWELFDGLYHRKMWEDPDRRGTFDYSGNPPLGTAAVIPYDAPDDVFARHRTLVFLGRNSMDDALYERLIRFVDRGGTLLLAATHLGTAEAPGEPYRPYRGGDWSRLTGVRIRPGAETNLAYGLKFKVEPDCGWRFPLLGPDCDPKFTDGGFRMPIVENVNATVLAVGSDRFVDRAWRDDALPVLYSHRIGRGTVVLLASLDAPGARGVRNLYSFLLTCAADGVDAWPKVECSDRVRWSVYEDGTVYLLNTEPSLSSEVVLRRAPGGPERRIMLAPSEIKVEKP